jgi:uncharacterized cupin superfamily protein
MPKKIVIDAVEPFTGTRYPEPFDRPCLARAKRRLSDAAGLTQFGVNLTRLPPGSWSSQRHWHSAEDEFIVMMEGEAVLVTDSGEETLRPGDCAGFKAGVADGHHLQNRSDHDVVYLEVGTRLPDEDEVAYPDIDLRVMKGRDYSHRDGTPYPKRKA